MSRMPLDDALDLHGISRWGNGFFGISSQGDLTVRPTRDPSREASIAEIVAEIRRRGSQTPLVLRFPQILGGRIEELVTAFRRAMTEFECSDQEFLPVFPIKVNQRHGVVESLLSFGRSHRLGLEVGSRAELMAAIGMDLEGGELIVVNGYKDRHTLDLASLGAHAGRRIVVVLVFEVDYLIEALRDRPTEALPEIGLRARLFSRGAGKWWKSTGATSKFGLTTAGLIEATEKLERAGLTSKLSMLHFHIGSQIPEIRRLKSAFREGARIYAQLVRRGAPLSLLNVGGGLAVDYGGSRTASDASMNYTVEEYANDVVYTVREVCDEEGIAFPTLVSESGRALAAYHAVLVTDILGRIDADRPLSIAGAKIDNAPRALRELVALREDLSAKTYREFYHDAVELRDELMTLFNVGIIDLDQRAVAEQTFWGIARDALEHSRREKVSMEEFEQLERALHEKYIANFSVFQSTPDHWALDQLFPVLPLTHLTDPPTRSASFVDITCDSDGEIDRFIDVKQVKEAIGVFEPTDFPERSFDVAVLLVGAYQDVMGDMHNLFGTPDDAYVTLDPEGSIQIDRLVPRDSVKDVLEFVDFDPQQLAAKLAERLEHRRREGVLDEGASASLLEEYRNLLVSGTYLDTGKNSEP